MSNADPRLGEIAGQPSQSVLIRARGAAQGDDLGLPQQGEHWLPIRPLAPVTSTRAPESRVMAWTRYPVSLELGASSSARSSRSAARATTA